MDTSSIIIGSLALSFALFTLTMRFISPTRLGKLAPLKEKFGDRHGEVIHSIFYIAIPLLFGIFCMLRASQGLSVLA